MSFQQYNQYPVLTPVRLTATDNVTGTYYNGPLNNGVGATFTLATGVLTLDGFTVNVGDRICLPYQDNTNENGVYVCTQAGAVGVSAILQRSADMQCIPQLMLGQYFSVGQGVALGGSFFVVGDLPTQLGIDGLLLLTVSSNSGLGSMAFQNATSVAITGGSITGATGSVLSGTTAAYAGGGTSNAFTATGVTASMQVVGNILTSTNNVSITKIVPTTNTITVSFSADPGANTTVNWIAG